MKNIVKRKKQEGFSIIEVLIVLAIAGLLMAVIFIAVPQLQRNARDNSRQSIVQRIKSEMETYSGNNQGRYPLDTTACGAANNAGRWCDFYNRYVGPPAAGQPNRIDVSDPSTGNNVVAAATSATFRIGDGAGAVLPANPGEVTIARGARCDGEGLAASGTANATTKNFALVIGLDRAGTRYCLDNG